MKKILGLFFIFIIGVGSATRTSADPSRTAVRVGHFSNITHAQALIGRGEGWFEKSLSPDAPIDWKTFNAGPSAVEALFAGQLDIAYIGPSPAVNAYVKSQGEAVRIVAGASSGGAALLVRADSGITKPEDFHGKKIASPQLGNTQDVSLRSWLAQNNLKLSEKGGDVSVLPVSNSDHVSLFLKKEIEASWTVEPWVSILEKTASAKVYLEESSLWPDGKYATTVVLVRTEFLKKNPELVKKFLKTHVELTTWINAHPEEAKAAFKKEIERETGKPMDQIILDSAWKRVAFTTDPLAETVKQQAHSAYLAGFLKKEPDLTGLFENGLLKELSAGKVESAPQK